VSSLIICPESLESVVVEGSARMQVNTVTLSVQIYELPGYLVAIFMRVFIFSYSIEGILT
jgi:hypothetical protein